jgi:tetratricopeptide (TPR) repeat protein
MKLLQRDPARYVLALARGAEGASEANGPGAALNLLRGAPGIDYKNPSAAPVLRPLVRFAHAAKKPKEAERVVAAALKAHPDASVFHELNGLHLELAGSADAARAAYRRAVELDPRNPGALAGLARLALASDPAAALALFDRAAAADPEDPEPALGAARALRAAQQFDQASKRIDALLHEHPYEGKAAAEQVAMDLERNTVTARTLDRANRAVRFGGGVDSLDQLSEVHARLGQNEDAARIAARAKLIREKQAEPGQAGDAEKPAAEGKPSAG